MSIGMRVELHPLTDQALRGHRYATVLRLRQINAMVQLEANGQRIRMAYERILCERPKPQKTEP